MKANYINNLVKRLQENKRKEVQRENQIKEQLGELKEIYFNRIIKVVDDINIPLGVQIEDSIGIVESFFVEGDIIFIDEDGDIVSNHYENNSYEPHEEEDYTISWKNSVPNNVYILGYTVDSDECYYALKEPKLYIDNYQEEIFKSWENFITNNLKDNK